MFRTFSISQMSIAKPCLAMPWRENGGSYTNYCLLQYQYGLVSLVEQQVEYGEVGKEAVLVAEYLIIGLRHKVIIRQWVLWPYGITVVSGGSLSKFFNVGIAFRQLYVG